MICVEFDKFIVSAAVEGAGTEHNYVFEDLSNEILQELDQILLAQGLNPPRTNGEFVFL